MKAFCFTLTILCVVQSILAYPRPDFAISGTVSGSLAVMTSSNDLNTAATNVGAKGYTPSSGYTKLSTVGTALQAIGDAVVEAGTNLASSLSALATNRDGPIATVFGTVITNIDAFTTLLSGTVNGNTATVQTNTGNYIPKQFTDAFKTTKTTLGNLKTAITTLKSNIEAAKTAAGTSTSVSAAIIRAKVPSKSVNAVITEIRNLRANMPLIQYVIDSSLDNLEMVDIYVKDLNLEITNTVAGRYHTSYGAFQANLNMEAVNINSRLNAAVGGPVSTIIAGIKTDLEANAKYTSDLATPIGALATAFLDSVQAKNTAITGSFSTYIGKVPNIFTDLSVSLGMALCASLKTVSEVQIANGGFSDFCFSKYSPRVFAQVSLTIDAFDVCYEKEVNRLINFESSIENIGVQISYNTADLLDNLNVCLSMPTVDTKGACFTMLGPYYTAIAAKVESHLTSINNLVTAETKASYNRLAACLNVALGSTILTTIDISTSANSCLTDGPQP